MAVRHIFLSASVPDARRDPRYYTSADLVAIRDSVKALATVILPHASLCWGGHPAITPLVRWVAEDMKVTGAERVRLFQSAWFIDRMPTDNAAFESYVLTERRENESDSIAEMRAVMLRSAEFEAAIFIGGMEGVEEEFRLFRERFPEAVLLPIASTGGAAAIVYEQERERSNLPEELLNNYAYPSLFRRLLALPSGRPQST